MRAVDCQWTSSKLDPGEPRVQLLDDGVEERIVAARNVVRGRCGRRRSAMAVLSPRSKCVVSGSHETDKMKAHSEPRPLHGHWTEGLDRVTFVS